MAPQSELTALAQEIMEMDSETFEIADYSEGTALQETVYTSSTSSTSSCSSTA